MDCFAKEKVNLGRQAELDCLKAISVFFMILFHAYESLADNTDNVIFLFLHEMELLMGAAVFMIAMGMGICYSRSSSPAGLAKRGISLLTIGQIVNLTRDSIPCLIGYWITGRGEYLSNVLVLQTDVLTFAGLAFLLMALLVKLRMRPRTVLLIGALMNAAAFLLFGVFRTTGVYAFDMLLGFFVATEAESYFPLFSYFVFVGFGYALGEKYQYIRSKDALSVRVLAVGAPVLAGYFLLRHLGKLPFLPEFGSIEQYVLNPLTDAACNCLSAVVLLALFFRLLRLNGGAVPRFAGHLSKNVISYYCISYAFYTPVETLLWGISGKGLPGSLPPLLYGLLVIVCCYLMIEWNGKRLHFTIAGLTGRKRVIVYTAVWALTAVILLYTYPRTEAFATVWNDYLGM